MMAYATIVNATIWEARCSPSESLFKSGDAAIDSDAVYADLKRHFTEEEIIELALVCAETDGVGKFARSLQMRTWDEACEILAHPSAAAPSA